MRYCLVKLVISLLDGDSDSFANFSKHCVLNKQATPKHDAGYPSLAGSHIRVMVTGPDLPRHASQLIQRP
jgi:hypothetical protein